jgi:hypothetical protein
MDKKNASMHELARVHPYVVPVLFKRKKKKKKRNAVHVDECGA